MPLLELQPFGVTDPGTHDSRYDVADEFVDVCLQLWEGGWDDGAEVRDRARNVYADPAGLHRTEHVGEHFRVSGQFAVAPSRQRTPVLFQAGTSARGRAFAARNAEALAVQPGTNRVFVVSKVGSGGRRTHLWVAPPTLDPAAPNVLTRLATLPVVGASGAAFSPGPASALVTASRSVAGAEDPRAAAEALRDVVWAASSG